MKLRFTPRAVASVLEIVDYLHDRNPAAATRVRSDIYATLQNLMLFPEAGRRQTVDGVRKIVTGRYSYLIYYTFDATNREIVVLSVKHPARRRDFSDQ